MERTFIYRISDKDLPATVHQFLRGKGYSRHILASLKPHPDAVLRNKKHVWFSDALQINDELAVTVRDDQSSVNIVPAPVPFEIVHEDEDLMVINKPAGISIHPAINHPADTLANGIAKLYEDRGIPYVFRCINRLDRDTTGLLILANNVYAASLLEEALQRREISRTYLAVADGEVPPAGTIDQPIGRKEGSLIERCIDPVNGDRAVTHFRRLAVFPRAFAEPLDTAAENGDASGSGCNGGSRHNAESGHNVFSLVELQLETGRTHQIRVHLAAAGHPLAGDTLYHPLFRDAGSETRQLVEIRRQALHAWKLMFTHPITGATMCFAAPLPEDLRKLIPQPVQTRFSL
ncbi:MAG: RluA family pseudouridine synthase [Eubacterium sp.]|nr:RluA family pseudouridine synthase [Eubacterium sp.]